jgi:hypothetical protein
MKAKLVEELMRQRMTVEEFVNWYENITKKYSNLPWYNMVAALENDE